MPPPRFCRSSRAFASAAGVSVGTKDISLAGRIIAVFPEFLTEEQRIPDDLAILGELVKTPEANVIKLPNVSASVPQLVAAVKELQGHGYAIPDYPEDPQTDQEKDIRARFDANQGLGGQPGPARGQFRPPRGQGGEGLLRMANPHRMGDWTPEQQDARGLHVGRRFPLERDLPRRSTGRRRRRSCSPPRPARRSS